MPKFQKILNWGWAHNPLPKPHPFWRKQTNFSFCLTILKSWLRAWVQVHVIVYIPHKYRIILLKLSPGIIIINISLTDCPAPGADAPYECRHVPCCADGRFISWRIGAASEASSRRELSAATTSSRFFSFVPPFTRWFSPKIVEMSKRGPNRIGSRAVLEFKPPQTMRQGKN